jgi:hypothetical protein
MRRENPPFRARRLFPCDLPRSSCSPRRHLPRSHRWLRRGQPSGGGSGARSSGGPVSQLDHDFPQDRHVECGQLVTARRHRSRSVRRPHVRDPDLGEHSPSNRDGLVERPGPGARHWRHLDPGARVESVDESDRQVRYLGGTLFDTTIAGPSTATRGEGRDLAISAPAHRHWKHCHSDSEGLRRFRE